MEPHHEILTVEETAEQLRMKPATIRDWIYQQKIDCTRIGRRVFIKRATVEMILRDGLDTSVNSNKRHLKIAEG